jgi:predicted alpha/beta superfamily hydrolase
VARDRHLPKRNPLSGPHLTMMRLKSIDQLQRMSGDQSYSHSVTFTGTDDTKEALSDAYLAFLEKTALPAIERAYRADGQQRTFMGHSYGALLGAQALLKKPGLFRHAVLSSPSLWFGQSQMLKDFGAPNLPALPKGTQVLLYAGSFEVPAKGRANPRYNREVDLAGDMQRLARLLRERATQAQVEAKVFDDEDHLSVFPRMATHALMRLHPRRP